MSPPPAAPAAGGVSAATLPRPRRPWLPACGCSRSPAAARSALSSTAPCRGGSRNVPGQRPVLLEPPRQPAPHPRRRVIGLAGLPVGAGEPLQLVPGHRPGDLGQPRLGVRGRDPGQRPHLRIRQPARRELCPDHRQVPQRPRHPDVLPGGPGGHLALPRQPRAQLFISQLRPASARSKSASSTRNRHVAAVRCPASSQICASSRSNGTTAGASGTGMASPGTQPGSCISNMYLTIAPGSDNPE